MRRVFNAGYVIIRRNCAGTADTAIPQPLNREGDGGTSETLSGVRLPKDHKLFHAIGATEELLCSIGLAREHALEYEHEYTDKLKRIQTVVIDISTAISKLGSKTGKPIPPHHTAELEEWIREYSKELPEPENYVIPGSGVASSSLQVARSICRRTERVVVPLVRDDSLDKGALVYLNRLADFLFVVARIATKRDKRTETIYTPEPDEPVQHQ